MFESRRRHTECRFRHALRARRFGINTLECSAVGAEFALWTLEIIELLAHGALVSTEEAERLMVCYRQEMHLTKLFVRPREISSRWHAEQARVLIEEAKSTKNATLLVYAALEARLSLERYIFEVGVLVRNGSISAEELRTALNRKGLNTFLSNLIGDWRRYLKFSAEMAHLNGVPLPTEVVPPFDRFRRALTQLSGYCHWIADPATIEDPQAAWFKKGVRVVEDSLAEVARALDVALIIESLEPEVKDLWENYRDDNIDLVSVRTRLKVMWPVLDSRFRQG